MLQTQLTSTPAKPCAVSLVDVGLAFEKDLVLATRGATLEYSQ